ncbi:MAG: bis(5'-nucleosyl)-tetraphosphatase (symmetrical) YqeK [Rubrobacteraceae bacterium]
MEGWGTNEDLLATADFYVRNRLSKKRYAHTLRVADTAERLAGIHGLDAGRTRLAALLHDAARELEPREYLALADEWEIPLGEHEKGDPKLLHGPIAAELAIRELDLVDEEVLEAIRAHTVGSPGMGPVALAVYVADKIEPARDYPSVERLRKLAERDLHEAAAEAFRRTGDHNEKSDRPTHPTSLRTLEWLEETIYRRVDERDGETP